MKKRFFLFFLLSAALLGQRCGHTDGQAPAATPDESIPVRVATVTHEAITVPIYGSGMLNFASEQRLAFKVGGVIQKIYVDEGDNVRAGQLLALLNRTEIDAQANQAKQALDKAERDLKRVEGLYRDSSATLEQLQNATTGRDVAAEGYRIATFNQNYAEIRAGRSGKIVKKLMNEGEITGPGTPVLVLYEAGKDDWVVDVNLPDRDWARLQMGTAAEIRMDAYPGKIFRGKVTRLAPAANPENGLYEVEISVQPQGERFAPGLFAKAAFAPRDAANYPVIPVEALIEGDGLSAFVFAPEPDGRKVRKVPIAVAFIDNDKVFVSKGLDDVKEVVTAGAPYLNETKTIRLVQ